MQRRKEGWKEERKKGRKEGVCKKGRVRKKGMKKGHSREEREGH